ncbi:unnamed protein product [Paramecium primaurelia]|uniref:Uncharacterized protein n=1 Tax=Paramecium primaurelia TaxID=5886 RepID=A0A8S1K987_PARPR|nr:unnamed protein product [Paramecium primaurelia]
MALGYFDSIIMFDNQSIYNMIDQQLDLYQVDYFHLNNVIAQIICSYPDLYYFSTSYGKMSLINDYTRKKQNQTYFIKYLKLKRDQTLSINSINIFQQPYYQDKRKRTIFIESSI